MTLDDYAATPICRHCGRSAHTATWVCAIGAAVLNGGFAALIALTRPAR